jgi:regulatory protein spx
LKKSIVKLKTGSAGIHKKSNDHGHRQMNGQNGSGNYGGSMSKKVTLYTDAKDPYCAEVEKFLKGFNIILQVHDIRLKPLNERQLSNLLGYFDLAHFLSSNGKSGKTKDLDTSLSNRPEILKMIAEDNSLLRKPIVVSGRLMTLGFDRRIIQDMLQIKADDSPSEYRAESAA